MFSRMRLIFTAFFLSLALIACNDDSTAPTDNADEAATTPAAQTATQANGDAAKDLQVEAQVTEADLIKQHGEPDITQRSNIDQLEIVHHEWHTDEGIISVQLHNGEVAYTQFTPKK